MDDKNKDEIENLWREFSGLPFPNEAHKNNFDLELIDTFVSGCISSFVSNNSLEDEKAEILKKCIKDLKDNFNKIPQSAQSYFKKLETLGVLVLNQVQ